MINPYEYRKKAQLAIGGVDYNVQPLINNNNGNTVQQQASNEEQNWFVRGLSTIGNLAKNVVEGAVKSIEGIVDAGAMLVGLFGADVDNFVNYDFTADLFGTDEEGEGLLEWSWGRALEKASYLDDDNFINQVANGVGGMLPTIALAVASGGTSIAGTTAAKALSVASKVAFVAGAAGNASEEAFKQGANYGQALGYGALSGAIEAGTEYIGGRVMGETTDLSKTLLGKLAIKTGTDKAISTGVGKAAYTFVSEGMEEVLSDLLNPVAKRITGVDKEATVDWGELPKTFLVGGATASVLNGIQNGASALKNSERGGKHYVRVAEEMQTIENTIGAQATLQSKQGISQENYDAIGTRANERTLRSLENMSSEFKKMTAEERSNALKTIAESSPTIASVFEASGDIKTSIRESIQESISNKVVGNASADLVLRGNEVKATLEEVNKENGYNLEVDNDALTEVERGNYAKEIKAIQNIGNLSDSKLSLVIVKNNNNVNSFLEKRGNVIYASRETLSNGTWANKLAHEVTHFAEDSKEFKRFVDFVLEDQKAVKEAINDIIKASYGITENELTRTISKLASDKKLTKKENLAYSELIAHISEKLFTDEKSIDRLARSDKGLFNKIKNRISDMVENLKDTNAKETVSKLRKAEQLFNNALKSIAKEKEEFVRNLRKTTNEYKRDKKIYNMLEEDERASWLEEHGYVAEDFNDDILDNGEQQEEIDFSPQMAYSKKAQYISYDKVGEDNIRFIKNELYKLYTGLENTIADNVVISKSDTLFVLDTGKEEGSINFGIKKVIKVSDSERRNRYINNINKESYEKGFGSRELFEKLGVELDNNSRSNVGQQLQQNNGTANRETTYNKEGIPGNNENRRSENVKFSLKDSQGNTLSEQQREFFKDSKVVDDFNRLLILYHQTSDDFNIFDTTKKGAGKTDYLTPNGIFLKPNNKDIGLKGKKQMSLYANIVNPLEFNNRVELEVFWSNNIPGYMDVAETFEDNNKKYQKEFDEAFDTRRYARRRLLVEYDNLSNEEKGKLEEQSINKSEIILEKWDKDNLELSKKAKGLIENYLRENNIDGIHILKDEGSFGRVVETWIALKPNQVKNISNDKPTTDNDIRFSLKSLEERYNNLIKKPNENIKELKSIVDEYAKLKGYTENSDYQGSSAFNGQAPTSDYYDTKQERVDAWESGEFEGNQTLGDFIDNKIDIGDFEWQVMDNGNFIRANNMKRESITNLRKVIDNKEKTITMYRSVPKSIAESKFRNGDWITPSRTYAVDNAELHDWESGYKIIEQKVSVDNIWWDGNDINEWGYDDLKDYKYRNTANNIKLADIITYDDKGKIVPLNKRFDENNKDIRFSLKDDVEKSVKEKYGDTYRWKEVGYILTDGTRLDLSGRNEGAPGGYRSIDHREIFEDMVIDDEDYATSENMIEFMGRGNIRVIPEYPGINLQVEPNEAQYKRIGELVESLGWKEGTFIVDFDNSNGEVKDTIEYDGKMSWRKVVDDIKYYFKEGRKPYQSELSKFRFSLKDSNGNSLSQEQERFFRNSKIRDKEGNLLVVYHGTNSDDFYVFDKDKIGESSGDRGFFGEGFYFASHKDEAHYYGENIIDAYLNIKKPYYFNDELFQYKNQEAQYDRNDYLIFITNFVDKFSDILPNWLHAYSFTKHKDISLKELAKIYKDTFNNKVFDIKEIEGEFGKEYLFRSDKTISHYTNSNGKTFSFEEYGFETRSLDKNLSQAELASIYVIEKYKLQNIPNFKQIILESDFSNKLKSLGYDGIVQSAESDEIVAFEPNQIKKIDNKAPTLSDDIRFSRKPANDIKARANLVYDNVYTKKETRQFIEDILSQTGSDIDELTYGEFTASLKGKTNIIEHFFEKLNSAEGKSKTKIAREMTDYIIDSISLEEVAQSEVAKESLDELKVLREYRNKIDVSGYSKEINTVKGNNSLILQWGKKGGMEIYDVVRNLQERGHFTQVNLQDSFNDFDLFEEFTDYYGKLVEDVRNASKVALSSVLSEDKLSTLKENMTKNLLEMVREGGELSTLGKLKENFSNSIKTLKHQFAKNTNYWKAKATYQGDIWRTVADLRGYTEKGKIEKLGSATVLKDPYFKKMLEDMGKITWGGRIDPAKARACMEGLKQFFNKDNKLLQDYFEATYGETLTVGDISQATAEIEGTSNSMFNHLLDQFAELELAKKEDGTYRTNYLTTEELKATSTILKMCKHFLLHYDAIYEDGKRIEQKQAATKYYQLAEKSLNTHTVHKSNLIGWVSDKLFDYNAMIMSPKFVCEMLDGYYEDGFNSHYQQRFWRDSLQMEYDRMYLLENSDKFFKENKDYKKRLFDKNIQVKIGDYSLTIAEAVDLYLMSTQDNGLLTLTEGAGFVFDNERGGVTQCGTVTQEQINSMYEQFTAEDKEYIKILKDIYKKGGVEFKKPTDISRMGFSNIIDGEYYTLTRWKEAIAKSTSDIRSAIKDIQIANNLSINKARRTRARNIPLMVGDSYQKMIRYVNQITLYKNFSEDLANFDKLFTKNISDTTSPKTIKMIMDGKVWDKTSRYWGDLLADVQGVGMTQDSVSSSITKVLEALRSNYAKAQLGFNLKVCMSQFASYPTAFIKLDAGVLTRALGHTVNYDDMDKYSQAATTRNYNKAIVKAEGVIDKVSSIGNVLTKGIQWSDRKTIGRLWVASQLQIEKTEGLKFGSIENMKKAGLLLDEVITETQPTYMAIDRSALQRSKNTLAKTISMFTSVPMKQVSNLIGSIAKLKAYKTRIRNGESINTQELNQAKKGVARAVGANVAANLMYAMICQLIKHIYNKDDEEENNGETIPEQILSQFFDTSISMFPILSDIYEGLAKGYEIDVYETSAINDLIASVKSVVDLAGKVVNGEADTQDIMNSLKKSLFAGGLIVGIPVRNMYNTIYGFTKRISPSTAYKINSLFVEPKSSDLKTALNKGDMELASVILTSLMGKKGFTVSEQQASTLAELYGQGYSLPSAIPNKITINGEEVELTVKQQGEFGQVYSRASSIADKILSDGSLNGKSNEVKAKTISYIYKYYYYEAQAKSLNIEVDSKLYMFGQLIDIQKLAMIISEVPILVEGLSNKKVLIQRYLQKQKLSAAQKYILMGYFGYSNKSGQGLVKALINRTNLSKEQKEALLEKCGY